MQMHFAPALLRLSVLTAAVSAVAPHISARHLSPSEALSAVEACAPRKIHSAAAAPMELRHTVADSLTGLEAVYVFARENAPGFCLAAADDAVGDVLLGYSATSAFDASVPGMQWLLEAYGRSVAEAAGGEIAPRRVAREAVEPMASTMWAQEAPYNDMCPELDGSRTAAGCVAVAVAQAMKVHRWPAAGVGEKAYSYTLVEPEGNPTVEVASDFASHTYRWDDMLDSYSGTSAAEQREAVAQLVFDCGVAATTEYSASSSARSFDAGCGMIEHFAYDKGMRYLDRRWMPYAEWEDIVYGQLSRGLPVVYSGSGPATGHTFLIDGADADGLFHFNWGWYGISDGYYSLADLSPVDPAGEIRSYNSGQNMLVDITPDKGSPLAGSMAVADVLVTNRTSYNADTDYINVMGGFYSFALARTQYSLGFKAATDTPVYVSVLSGNLDPTWGYTQLTVYAGNFPEGEYDVYPVFRTPGGEWTPMYFNLALTSGHLHFVKRDGVLTVSGGAAVEAGSIALSHTSLKLDVGESVKLEATVYPADTTDSTVTWTSSDPATVSVGADGTVRALADGYAEITATCGPVSAVCTVSAVAGLTAVAADGIRVAASRGMVSVEGAADATVTVYALDGSVRYRGVPGVIALPAGVYVVAVDGRAIKAVVD